MISLIRKLNKSYNFNFNHFNDKKINLNLDILLHEKNLKFLKGVFSYRKLMKLVKTRIWNVFYRFKWEPTYFRGLEKRKKKGRYHTYILVQNETILSYP